MLGDGYRQKIAANKGDAGLFEGFWFRLEETIEKDWPRHTGNDRCQCERAGLLLGHDTKVAPNG